jgi:hypothetical protein
MVLSESNIYQIAPKLTRSSSNCPVESGGGLGVVFSHKRAVSSSSSRVAIAAESEPCHTFGPSRIDHDGANRRSFGSHALDGLSDEITDGWKSHNQAYGWLMSVGKRRENGAAGPVFNKVKPG